MTWRLPSREPVPAAHADVPLRHALSLESPYGRSCLQRGQRTWRRSRSTTWSSSSPAARWRQAVDAVARRLTADVRSGRGDTPKRSGKQRRSVIHGHFGWSAPNTLPLKREFGLPLVTTFYGVDMSALPRVAEWQRYTPSCSSKAICSWLKAPIWRVACPTRLPEGANRHAAHRCRHRGDPVRARRPLLTGRPASSCVGRFARRRGFVTGSRRSLALPATDRCSPGGGRRRARSFDDRASDR